MNYLTNLAYIRKDGKVLLGMKKRGFGANKWNGYGGKVKEGETVEESLVREFEEESGVKIKEFHQFGELDFSFENGDFVKVHIFEITNHEGEPVETEEVKPEWFLESEIPFPQMWADDPLWFDLFLSGKKFKGKVKFNKDNEVSEHEIVEIQ